MLHITSSGQVIHAQINLNISPSLEGGPMVAIHGIVVHQTGSLTATATLNGYKQPKPNGAHFLIDKDGTIYQTASVYKKTRHVGYLKSRCVAKHTCSPTELQDLKGKKVGKQIGTVETKKKWPVRYPSNEDSIGIEIVSLALPKTVPENKQIFESVTKEQQTSLKWLVQELTLTLKVQMTEVFRHPEVSWKNVTEASTATW